MILHGVESPNFIHTNAQSEYLTANRIGSLCATHLRDQKSIDSMA